jgi:hypothetical protein
MLRADDLAPSRLAARLNPLLPLLDDTTRNALAPTFERIGTALSRLTEDHDPDLMAYAMRRGPQGNPQWLRISVAFRQRTGSGLDVVLDALQVNFIGRILLLARGQES